MTNPIINNANTATQCAATDAAVAMASTGAADLEKETPPAPTVQTPGVKLELAVDSGFSQTDKITNNGQVNVSGISQRQFAVALGTASNHICQVERDHCIPGAKLLRGMREQFGIDINWLLSGETDYVATTLLEREVDKLIRQFQAADPSARAMLLQTASFTAAASR